MRPVRFLAFALVAALACDDKGGGSGTPRGVSDSGVATPGAGMLRLESADPSRGVMGTFVIEGKEVRFASTVDPASGNAIARMSSLETGEVSVMLSPTGDGAMTWKGIEYSGKGPLPATATAALGELGASPLGRSLALVPLELGCKTGAAETDLQRAALVFPWQLLIKYDPRFPDAPALEAMSSCKYFSAANQAPTGRPVPEGLELSNSDRVPHVFGIFPLDGAGATTRTVPLGHDTRPCGALCPGTCGPDCMPAPTCTTSESVSCVQVAGINTGVARPRTTWRCSTHMGCRWHDQCYDDCNSASGCNSWGAAFCRRSCDRQGVNTYGFTNARNWVKGKGPFDGTLMYTHDFPERDRMDTAMCPMRAVDAAASDGPPGPADARDGGVDGPTGPDAPRDLPPDLAPDRPPDLPPDLAPDRLVCPTYTATVGFCAGEGGCPAGGSACAGTSCIPGHCYTRYIAGCSQEKCPPGSGRNYTNHCMCPVDKKSVYDPCRTDFLVSCDPL